MIAAHAVSFFMISFSALPCIARLVERIDSIVSRNPSIRSVARSAWS